MARTWCSYIEISIYNYIYGGARRVADHASDRLRDDERFVLAAVESFDWDITFGRDGLA